MPTPRNLKSLLKLFSLSVCFMLFFQLGYSQEIGGIPLQDHLATVTHPNCPQATNKYITGFPNDSIWVNFALGDQIQGLFTYSWSIGDGGELVIESGYHQDSYEVRLLLDDGSYSQLHTVTLDDWLQIADLIGWKNQFTEGFGCEQSSFFEDLQWITVLDFATDFALQPSAIVVGVEITFPEVAGLADIAGIYITENANPCSQVDLGPDSTICTNQTLVLTPGSYATYLWNDGSTDSTLEISGAQLGQGIHTFWVSVVDDNNCISQDSIQVTVELCNSLSEVDATSHLSIFPNPTTSTISITLRGAERLDRTQVEIFDAHGRLVGNYFQLELIDVSHFPAGVYYCKVGEIYSRFIKD